MLDLQVVELLNSGRVLICSIFCRSISQHSC